MNNKVLDISPVTFENDQMQILDQTLLPNEMKYLTIDTKEAAFEAIHKLRVRGAPAIGIAAAYGTYISIRDFNTNEFDCFFEEFQKVKKYLASSRPTAVNLFWALERMEACILKVKNSSIQEIKKAMLTEAHLIKAEDELVCKSIGENALTLLKPGMGILTHCNAGTIATSKYGTALSAIYLGYERGYNFKVFADETRPLLQGARLTAWELHTAGIDVTLICDNMAASVMKSGLINAIVVGCDRVAKNGDTANKIGTLGLGILAKEYNIPLYVHAPISTIDLETKNGEDIEIELRSGEEIYKMWFKENMAPEGVATFNPAFDVTDHKFITAIITENGICYPPYEKTLTEIVKGKSNE